VISLAPSAFLRAVHASAVAPPRSIVTIALGFMQSAQRKVLDPASKVGEVRGPGDQLQVVDALADRHLELMGVHQPGKGASRSLPLRGLCQKVRVPSS